MRSHTADMSAAPPHLGVHCKLSSRNRNQLCESQVQLQGHSLSHKESLGHANNVGGNIRIM